MRITYTATLHCENCPNGYVEGASCENPEDAKQSAIDKANYEGWKEIYLGCSSTSSWKCIDCQSGGGHFKEWYQENRGMFETNDMDIIRAIYDDARKY